MKHPIEHILKITAWLIAGCIFGLIMAPHIDSSVPAGFSVVEFLSYATVFVLAGALFWSLLMNKATPETVEKAFAVGIAALAHGVVDAFTSLNIGFRLAVAVSVYFLFIHLVMTLQANWKNVIRFTWISNLLMVGATAYAGTSIAVYLPWQGAIAFLFLISLYDAWAVWKSKSMIAMATFFMDRRIMPGIAIPYKDREKFALLGGGDVFFIVLVGVAFLSISLPAAIITMSFMVFGLMSLYVVSKEGVFYPALPFIFAGLLAGVGVLAGASII